MNQNIELKDLVHQLNLLVAEINHRVEPSNPLPKSDLIIKTTDRYQYKNNYSQNLVVFDFDLFNLVLRHANSTGTRKTRAKTAQLRIIYCFLYLYGIPLNDLISLGKIQLMDAIILQRIYSTKLKKYFIIRSDENTNYLINILKKEITLLFDHYNFSCLGSNLRYPTKLTHKCYFPSIPDFDLKTIMINQNIVFPEGLKINWKSIQLSYNKYFSEI